MGRAFARSEAGVFEVEFFGDGEADRGAARSPPEKFVGALDEVGHDGGEGHSFRIFPADFLRRNSTNPAKTTAHPTRDQRPTLTVLLTAVKTMPTRRRRSPPRCKLGAGGR